MLTLGYGAYALARPEHLHRQADLDPDQAVVAGRIVGARDVLSGLAIVAADTPDRRRGALFTRAAFDVADVAIFAAMSRSRGGRVRALTAAGTWATIATLLATRQPGHLAAGER